MVNMNFLSEYYLFKRQRDEERTAFEAFKNTSIYKNLEKEHNDYINEISFLKAENNLLNQQVKKYEATLKNVKFELETCIERLDEIGNFSIDETQNDEKINYILQKSNSLNLKLIKIPESLIIKNKPVREFHICKLCKNVLLEPKACAECEDLFCNSCLQDKLSQQNECPFCREAPFKQAKYNKQLDYILNQMILSCPFNCGMEISYEDFISHINNCANSPKYYKCELCEIILKTENLNVSEKEKKDKSVLFSEHNKSCPAVLRKCVHCNEEFARGQLAMHMKNCEYKLYYCATCKMKFPCKLRSAHNEYYCRQITGLHKIFEKIMQNLII